MGDAPAGIATPEERGRRVVEIRIVGRGAVETPTGDAFASGSGCVRASRTDPGWTADQPVVAWGARRRGAGAFATGWSSGSGMVRPSRRWPMSWSRGRPRSMRRSSRCAAAWRAGAGIEPFRRIAGARRDRPALHAPGHSTTLRSRRAVRPPGVEASSTWSGSTPPCSGSADRLGKAAIGSKALAGSAPDRPWRGLIAPFDIDGGSSVTLAGSDGRVRRAPLRRLAHDQRRGGTGKVAPILGRSAVASQGARPMCAPPRRCWISPRGRR